MLLILLLGFLATASSAPFLSSEENIERSLRDEMRSMKNFWQEFNSQMQALEKEISEFSRSLTTIKLAKEEFEGNEYIIEIPLPGFEDKDISVKARKSLVMIVATHNDEGIMRKYNIIRTLPDRVEPNGNWTFSNGLLRIVFPATEEKVEAVTEHSREEIEADHSDKNSNADIGVDKTNELVTNEIPNNTYLEGLKDVEFVPVH